MVDPPAHARAAATLDPPREDSLYCVISKIIGSTSGVVNGRSGVCRIPLPGSYALPRGEGWYRCCVKGTGAPIRVQPLASDRREFAPDSEAKDLIYPDVIQPYERLVEGAFVVYREGYYYLFFSERFTKGPVALPERATITA